MEVLTVSQFVEVTNGLLVAQMPPGSFEIEGEVASFGISGGQWVRFDLKDGDAIVNCFLTAWQLKEQIADGMKIVVTGYGKLYPKYGKFSFVVQSIRLSGEGSLKRAFELLQKKLQAEGLFDVGRKRELPRFPARVALITSRDAAAYTDFLRVSAARWPAAEIVHYHVGVQGASAAGEVVAALSDAGNRLEDFDVIVVTRGGGSMEDLHVFNTEEVARAVFASRVPVVSGVGHERDVTIIDMVADLRAATPSNAAELIFPDATEVLAEIRHKVAVQARGMDAAIERARAKTIHITYVVDRWVRSLSDRLETSRRQLLSRRDAFEQRLAAYKEKIVAAVRLLKSLHPQELLRRGYSYTTAENGTIIASAAGLRKVGRATQKYFDGDVSIRVDE
ncbi:MAG: exodeoxyribonuclease VII large subunit [Candidatus Magasanikbacteria bacterium]|nr:exodeoxyribonuclease VII large subunit [Candidatus Magasanikbacteria bacterium]